MQGPKLIKVKFKGISPYSQSKYIQEPKEGRETHDNYEKRTWRHRLHVNEDGNVVMPPMAFKNMLDSAAAFEGMPYKGKKTYTKLFLSGTLVMDPVVLPIKRDDVPGEWLFVPSDGRKGGGSRVLKCFPVIKEWGGVMQVHVLNEAIDEPVFAKHIATAGMFIGLGRFAPRVGGFYGRFEVLGIEGF
jgi:hypothetical protein